MTMDLYVFGCNEGGNFDINVRVDGTRHNPLVFLPQKTFTATWIEVVWVSWNDSVVAFRSEDTVRNAIQGAIQDDALGQDSGNDSDHDSDGHPDGSSVGHQDGSSGDHQDHDPDDVPDAQDDGQNFIRNLVEQFFRGLEDDVRGNVQVYIPSDVRDDKVTLRYAGMGLHETQVAYLETDNDLACEFFGLSMSEGIMGIVQKPEHSADSSNGQTSVPVVAFFASKSEIEAGNPMQQIIAQKRNAVQCVSVTGGGDVYVVMSPKEHPACSAYHGEMLTFSSIDHFKMWLQLDSVSRPNCIYVRPFKQLVSNATTTTMLTEDGKVLTWTNDPRFPKCLGRNVDEFTGAPSCFPSEVDYLSETKIVKIATGGFMTAAISEDGELFLWGQSNPESKKELKILKDLNKNAFEDAMNILGLQNGSSGEVDIDAAMALYNEHNPQANPAANANGATASSTRDVVGRLLNMLHSMLNRNDTAEEEHFVAHVPIYIAGIEARALDVAIGNGHILVTAQADCDGKVLRAVLGAGEGADGQLGLQDVAPFEEKFTEIPAFAGKKVVSLTAVGWSSWVVVKSEDDGEDVGESKDGEEKKDDGENEDDGKDKDDGEFEFDFEFEDGGEGKN